jgi:hypothetical protein
MIFAEVKSIIFKNKQNIPWNDVEDYLKDFIGNEIIVKEYGDVIHIQGDFPDEFTESRYTKKLRGALAKAKANAAQVIVEMLENAKNRRWAENKDSKHDKEANGGWYRYDVGFIIPVEHNGTAAQNRYLATAVVRIKDGKLYLYDVINIKKEASTPL